MLSVLPFIVEIWHVFSGSDSRPGHAAGLAARATELARSVAAYSRVSGRLTFFATGKCSGKHDSQRPEDHDKLLERAAGMVFSGKIVNSTSVVLHSV